MTMQPMTLTAAIPSLRHWLVDVALPFWAQNGIDRTHGGVHETLAFDGSPARQPAKRLRVLARQIYCFSHAKLLGWSGEAGPLVENLFDTLVTTGWHDDGGFIHLYNPDGTVQHAGRDTYDQCFCLLAFAWMIRAGIATDRAREALDQTAAFIDRQLAHPSGLGLREGVGIHEDAWRRANPHMHYFEASLACHQATGDDAWLARADHVADLFERFFFDPETGTLREYFEDDLSPLTNVAPQWLRVEPGHHYEWAWLLMRHCERRDRPALKAMARRLYDTARTHGHHHRTGAAADSMLPDGSDLAGRARCWPQTEAIKAAVAFAQHGDEAARQDRDAMLSVLFTHYLDRPIKGGWVDAIDDVGAVAAPDMPSSTFYHVLCALAEVLDDDQS